MNEQTAKLSWLKDSYSESIPALGNTIRKKLGVDLSTQQKLPNVDKALEYWIERLAQNGLHVFKDPFKDSKKIAGFCVYDEHFPVIYLNNSTSKTRQIFTIFHELAHLLRRQDFLNVGDSDRLNPNDQGDVERDCNLFAANFLVPDDDFKSQSISLPSTDLDDKVKQLAKLYKVSPAVILLKLFKSNKINQKELDHSLGKMQSGIFSNSSGGSGGDYYNNKLTYLGRPYTGLVLEQYFQGKINQPSAAEYLNVNVVTFDKKKNQLNKTFDNLVSRFMERGFA